MVENTGSKKENPSKNKQYLIFGAVFVAILAIIGFLIITKDTREDPLETGDESQLENKVDVVEVGDEEEDDEDLMLEDDEDAEDEDPVEEVEEVEEAPVLKPDLYIHEYTITEDPMQNEEITVHIEIVNQGEADAGSFSWEWFYDDDEGGCDEDVAWLDVGDKESFDCEFTYEDFGTFDTKLVIDSESEIDEDDEENNVIKEEIEVAEEEYVDLTVVEYSFDPVPKKDVPFELRIGIKNEGNVASGEFDWFWKPSWALEVCQSTVTELAPNSEKVVICAYEYQGCSTYETTAVIDSNDDVDEIDEDNNEYTEELIVPCF